MHREEFEHLLKDSIALLQGLPRERTNRRTAHALFERLKENHPGKRIDLLIDAPPGSERVEYDLLIEHPNGGTVALSWRADAASPWVVDYADHHNANFLVTVNGEPVTVQQALLLLQANASEQPDVMEEIIHEQLIAAAIRARGVTVSTAEIQKAADDFRVANGLLKAADTERWLEETGISSDEFLSQMEWLAKRRKFLDALVADGMAVYFENHSADFRRIQVFSIEVQDHALAMEVCEAAHCIGLVQAVLSQSAGDANRTLEGTLGWRFAFELPAEAFNARASDVLGPVSRNGGYWLAQILREEPANLNGRARDCIRGRLIDEWLAQARSTAVVRWHWL